MPSNGAELFTESLEEYGVTHIFGNPGTTELPIMNAIGDSELEYVLGLHEDIAVGMAAGYAKTRMYHSAEDPDVFPAGVVNLHVAPGLAHGIGNIFDSSLIGTGAPIVVTAGAHPFDHQIREPNLGGNLVQMTKQFTKWSAQADSIDSLPMMIRRAFRVALTPPTGPVFLGLPLDVMTAETDDEPARLGSIPTVGEGDKEEIDRAAEVIANADEPVMVVGDLTGRSGPQAVSAARDFAEAAGVRVHGELKASEVSFPMDHEQWFGRLPRDQEKIVEYLDTDVVVFCGVVSNTTTNPQNFDFISSDTTIVHISESPWELGKNYNADVSVIGDSGQVMSRLAGALDEELSDSVRDRRLSRIDDLQEQDSSANTITSDPDDPRASDDELAAAMYAAAPEARIVAEAPTSAGAVKNVYDFEIGQYYSNRGGGLGYGLPATIGSAIAEEQVDDQRSVIGLIGDGSYLYYPQSLYSAARYNVDVTVIVPDNRNYRILKDNTLRLFGGEEADYDFVGMDFEPPVDIPTNAKSHGAEGELVDDPSSIEDAVDRAVSSSGPVVLDVLTHD